MLQGLFGEGTVYRTLRTGLDDDMGVARRTAGRIANAANGATGDDDFQSRLAAAGDTEPVNLEEELVQLVDTTMRFDAETRLLREAYSRLRTAIGSSRG